jgi:predicted phage terminase large subunit-like protein
MAARSFYPVPDWIAWRRASIQSPWFQSHWGDRFVLTSDQNTKGNYLNDQKGYRVAISTGSGTTGHRADIIVFDDAMSVGQADSEAERLRINDYIRQSLYNRQDILSKTRIVVIGQRLHHQDYHTIFLPLEGCLHINLPLEYEKSNSFQSAYFSDPRTKEGELLWNIPKFQGQELARLKEMMGRRGYETQYQQRPSVQEGEILKRSDWRFYNPSELPANLKIVSGWDFAAKTGQQNDYTVGLTVGKCGSKFYILDLYKKRVEFPQAKRDFTLQTDKHNPIKIYVEDASNGTPLISEMSTTKYRSKIVAVGTKGKDKMSRVIPITPIVEAGNVLLPLGASWVDDFIYECASFPNGEHDDIVDALAMILNNERQNVNFQMSFVTI